MHFRGAAVKPVYEGTEVAMPDLVGEVGNREDHIEAVGPLSQDFPEPASNSFQNTSSNTLAISRELL
jgi:hypothetical protein